MMPPTLRALEEESIPVFITQDARQLAQGFANQQSTPAKAAQIYGNTLAISVVNNYLRIIGVQADVSHCDSWNPMMRMVMNTADLEIAGRGRLECRPISTEELNNSSPTCHIPSDVHGDRIGYVVVHLEEDEATLLGFTPTAETEQFPLSQLRPVSDLLPHLYGTDATADGLAEGTLTTLSRWLQEGVEAGLDAGWQTLDTLLNTPAVQYRRSPNSNIISRRFGKVLSANAPSESLADSSPLLLVHVQAPSTVSTSEGTDTPMAIDNIATDITITVQPSLAQGSLPLGLRLWLTDETGTTLMEAVNTEEHQEIALEFQAETGDRFNVHTQWADTVVTERFMV